MSFCFLRDENSRRGHLSIDFGILKWRLLYLFSFVISLWCSIWGFTGPLPAMAANTAATPWVVGSPEQNFQSLVYGASSEGDVVRVMGMPPDEVIHAGQMFPVIENYYYYDQDKSGAATIFVFENGLLVGLQMKTAGNQYVDMTHFLTSNGDRTLNQPMLGGFQQYYPWFPITSW